MRAPVDADYVREQYERVRRDATTTDRTAPCGHGLALLMTRGMSNWLEALQTLAPPPRVGAGPIDAIASSSDRVAWRADDRAQLTHVLASLVRTCLQEVVR
jgi:hypothetical protein